MTWDIFIHTDGHYKFWSVEKGFINNRWVYTGQVKYGRIGNAGTNHFYGSDSTVRTKINEKVNEGYRLYLSNQSDATPVERLVRLEIMGETPTPTPEPTPEPTPTPVQRANQRLTRVKIKKEYETTRTANIKKYDFTRPTLNTEDDIELKHDYVRNIVNPRLQNKFMEYFKAIPLEYRNNIREIGSPDQRNTIRDSQGETFVVIYFNNDIVGLFSINTRMGHSNVFYIKSTQRNKKNITKHMLKLISTMVSSATITINKTPATVEEEFQSILNTKTIRGVTPIELNRKVSGTNSNTIKRVVNKWQ